MKKRVLIGQEDPNKPFGDMDWRVEGPEDEGMTKVWIGKVSCGERFRLFELLLISCLGSDYASLQLLYSLRPERLRSVRPE